MHVPINRTNTDYYHNMAIMIQLEMAVIVLIMILGFSPFIGILHGVLITYGIRKTSRHIRGIDRPISLRRFACWYLLCHIPLHAFYCSTTALPKSR